MKPKMGLIAGVIIAGTTIYFSELNNSVILSQKGTESAPINASFTSFENSILAMESSSMTMDDVLASMLDKKQSFTINGSSDMVIQGKNGTVCSFSDSTFIREDGTVVSGPIKIELLECYDLKNILGAQLSTTSQDRLIETAGMINIVATENGRPLKVMPGKNYQLQFPRQKQNDFVLFTGERTPQGVMDWTLIEDENKPTELLSSRSNVIDSAKKDLFKNADFVEIRHSYMRKKLNVITKDDHFRWRLANGQNFNEYYLSNFNPSLEMVEDFKSKNLVCEITFKVNDQGDVIQSYISKTSYTNWDQTLLSFVQNLPQLKVDLVMPEYVYDHDIKLEFARGLMTGPESFLSAYRKNNDWEADKILTNVNSTDLNYYTFSASQLGWINCDRFVEDEDVLVEYKVLASDADSCNMSLIFDDMRSILKGQSDGTYVTFNNVPKDKSVRIVAIKCINGTPTLCSKKAVIDEKKPAVLDRFVPFTLKELDKTLTALEI